MSKKVYELQLYVLFPTRFGRTLIVLKFETDLAPLELVPQKKLRITQGMYYNNRNNGSLFGQSYSSIFDLYYGSPTISGKITRKNLVDQLREYQLKKKQEWSTVQFFKKTARYCYTFRSSWFALSFVLILWWFFSWWTRKHGPRTSLWLFFLSILLVASIVAFAVGYYVLAWLYFALTIVVFVVFVISFKRQKQRRRRNLLPWHSFGENIFRYCIPQLLD